MTQFRKISAAACLTAALSMTAAPAMAAELPSAPSQNPAQVQPWDGESVTAEHRRYRRHRHRNRVNVGDVLTGVLILGGIAAVADAASKPRRERVRTNPQPRYEDRRGRASQGSSGLDRAVSMCVNEIERDVRVENVDTVQRTGNGWDVAGTLYNGDGFSCQIDNSGAISNISFGGQVAATAPATAQDNQWDDARYREARAQSDQGGFEEAPVQTAYTDQEPTGPQPAYPGGPIDGDIPAEDSELGG